MAEKNFNARFKQKHDIEANWAKASFVPLAGEFIIYDTDENNPLPRIKVGDGETQINNLSFVDKGKMTYKGEVTELPSEANEGDVYKVSDGIKWVLFKKNYEYNVVECAITPDYFNVYIYGDSGSIDLYDTILEAVNKTGTTPSPIKLIQDDSEYIINVMSYNLTIYPDDPPPIVEGRFYGETNVSEYTYLHTVVPDAKFNIYYGINSGNNYIYHNNEWIEFTETYDDSNIITMISELENLIDNKANAIHYHSASNITSGTLSVSRGGTGKSSWNTNGLIYPSGSTTLTQLAIPTEESILMQKSNNAPYWIAKNTLAESDLSNIDNTVFKNKIQECGFEAGANNGGGFKKIGFTSDCDYVATSTDGLTAFTNAIAAAADGDTILVMPGTYISSNTLTIAKNINFVGVSMPTIGFAITISGDASAVYRTNWEGIKFTRAISALGYTDENDSYGGGGSTFNTINCIFRNITNNLFIGGTHNNSNFENIKNIWSDGTSTEVIFYNCNFVECKTFTNPYAGDITFNYCNIHNQSNSFLFDAGGYGGHYLSNTNIYNYNSSSSFNVGSITIQLDGCSIFGILPLNCSIDNGGITLTNTYHYAGSIPGDASTAPVTQSSMETYVDDTMNRTTSVDEADTNYSTYMARGTSLNSTETTPTANGTVAWTYE